MARGISRYALMSFRLRRQTPLEADVLAGVKRLLELHPAVAMWWRQNTGAGYVLSASTYKRLIAAGHLQRGECRWVEWGAGRGSPDTMGVLRGGRFVAVEVKRPGQEPDPDQQAWIDRAKSAGALAGWVNSIDQLDVLINSG
mgnify:CR=1 FL=1